MPFDDGLNHCETQASAFPGCFGGEERLENLFLKVFRNPAARVFHVEIGVFPGGAIIGLDLLRSKLEITDPQDDVSRSQWSWLQTVPSSPLQGSALSIKLDWQGRTLLNCECSPEAPGKLVFGNFSFPCLG